MAVKYTYTEIEVLEIVAKYAAGVALDTLAQEYNKSVASVRMKLVKLGVYNKVTKATAAPKDAAVTKKSATTKAEILAEFRHAFELVGAAKW